MRAEAQPGRASPGIRSFSLRQVSWEQLPSQCQMSNSNGAGLCVFQLTTAVTSAFLLAKVILSKVQPPTFSYNYRL